MSSADDKKQLIAKEVVTAADTIASAGKLSTVQAKTFIDYVQDYTFFKQRVRVVPVLTDWEFYKMDIGERGIVASNEAHAPSIRRGVSTDKVVVSHCSIALPWEISDEFFMYNVEQGAVGDHIMRMFAQKFANDVEQFALYGDTLGHARLESDLISQGDATRYVKDSTFALQDGWLKLARAGNVLNMGGAPLTPETFSDVLLGLPKKFRRNLPSYLYILAHELDQKFRVKLSSRNDIGARYLTSRDSISPFGYDVAVPPLFDFNPMITEHVTLNAAGGAVKSLLHTGIVSLSEVVTPTTLANIPTAAYVKDTDYIIDYTNGTIEAKAGGALAAGGAVKVTYEASPIILMTAPLNLIMAVGMDIKFEKGRDIMKGVDQYIMRMKVGFQIEETGALVLAKNIGETL